MGAISLPDHKEMRARIYIDSLALHPFRIQIKLGELFSLENVNITVLIQMGNP
jgi:hypothetical protein